MYTINPVPPTDDEKSMVREIGDWLWEQVTGKVSCLAPDKDMTPHFFIVGEGSVDICTLPFRNDDEKEAMMNHARGLLAERRDQALAAALAVPCYIRMLPLDQVAASVIDFTKVPKREAYMLHIETRRGVVVSYTAGVHRDPVTAPQLETPDVRCMDAPGTTLQGALVGFFMQPDPYESAH